MHPRVQPMAAAITVLFAVVAISPAQGDLAAQYHDTAQKIITAALLRNDAMSILSQLCDGCGNRLSGSVGLQKAVTWGEGAMKAAGLVNVRTEKVMVPHWERGSQKVELLTPRRTELPCLALGGSVGTVAGGIEADVLVVKSFAELDSKSPESVKGRIVVFNVPYEGYGKTVQYRATGASRAAKLGAVAVLVRSAGHGGVRTPHTGAVSYQDGVPKIPAAALAAEDTAMLGRLAQGETPVRIRIELGCRQLPDAESANVIGELVGRELPSEVVVIGGHLDSWDVGQGAQDDGGGCASTLEAVALIKRLDLKPRRTIRVVWFTNEENGARGAAAYFDAHRSEIGNHVAAIESDGGIEKLTGFGIQFGERRDGQDVPESRKASLETFRSLASLLATLNASEVKTTGGGVDVGPLMRTGVPGLSPSTTGERYFEWHHTEGDTVDKIDPSVMDSHVAALAVVAFVLADMPGRL